MQATPEAPPTPTGMLALPCGCEMLAVVAQELMKVGVCSKCGHRFPPTLGADSASDVSGRDFDSKAVSSDLDVSPSGQLAVVRFLPLLIFTFGALVRNANAFGVSTFDHIA